MAGCIPCFVIPLLLFIFHRYIQPLLLKLWNPWEKKLKNGETAAPIECTQSIGNWTCPCSNKDKQVKDQLDEKSEEDNSKLKAL